MEDYKNQLNDKEQLIKNKENNLEEKIKKINELELKIDNAKDDMYKNNQEHLLIRF